MALKPKEWHPVDRATARILAVEVDEHGLTHRAIRDATGLSLGRISALLRGMGAPISIGEITALGELLGVRASRVIARAELEVARDEFAEVRDGIDLPEAHDAVMLRVDPEPDGSLPRQSERGGRS